MVDLKSDAITSGHFATKVDDNPLWQYACQVYSQAGMEAALLNLQDGHGADVNLILHALWLASEGIEWTPECIPADYALWVAEQVIPIRTMRRRLKTDWVELRDVAYEGFRQQVKGLELRAEQYALAMLYVHCEARVKGVSNNGAKNNGAKNNRESMMAADNLQLLGEELNILSEHFELLMAAL